MKTIMVLVGVRGSGKTTVLEELRNLCGIEILQPSTTRRPRKGEKNEYDFRPKKEWNKDDFAWTIELEGAFYGLRKSELCSLRGDEIGITVFHPGNLQVLEEYRHQTEMEFVTIGLDTIESFEDQNHRIKEDSSRDEGIAAFREQRNIVRGCDVVLSGTPAIVREAIIQVTILLAKRGVVHSNAISALVNAGTLIKQAETRNIQPASYDLRLGDTVWCKGKWLKLKDDDSASIPPYSYIIANALEEVELPKFISAHYDLKLSLFFQGVTLSNGPQVDPGYSGTLCCLLFNGSDRNVGIRRGEHFATIEFLTTCKVTEGYKGEHQSKSKTGQFMESTTAVSSGGTLFDRFNKIQKSWGRIKSTVAILGVTIMAALSAIFIPLLKISAEAKDLINDAKKQQQIIDQTIKDANDFKQNIRDLLSTYGVRLEALEKTMAPKTIKLPETLSNK